MDFDDEIDVGKYQAETAQDADAAHATREDAAQQRRSAGPAARTSASANLSASASTSWLLHVDFFRVERAELASFHSLCLMLVGREPLERDHCALWRRDTLRDLLFVREQEWFA